MQFSMFNDEKEKSSDWKWSFKDYPEKNGLKVFSCFACGGGSTMGYKLCGCEVLGCCEIDPRMNKVYVENHHPKYNYLEDIRDFNKREDLPYELYKLDILDGSPPCFEAGTLVKTNNGYKAIEDIIVGDYVFTHNKNYCKVYDVMNKFVNEYYNLRIQGCMPFNVTPNHPFYVRRMSRHNKYGKRIFEQPKWVEVKDLCLFKNSSNTILEQDYVGFPIIQEEKIPEWNGVECIHNIYGKKQIKKVKNNLDLSDKDFWYFVGRYIGDGWQREDRKETIICCGKEEKEELESVIRNANFSYYLSEEKTTYKATISSVELFEYIKQFGKGAKNKHLTKDIFELPKDLLKNFIDGYLSADGYYNKKDNTYHISSISKELILGIQQCIAKCYNQPTTITTKINKNKIENREVNTNIAYCLCFRKEKCKQQHFICEDGFIWLPFRKKELIKEPLKVFNISVDKDESYTVYNLACHNCSTFSMAGQREDAWGKEKKFREGQKMQTLDDLLFVFIETVAKLKPKVAIMENVEGLMLGNAWKYVQNIYKRFNEIGYKVKHWLLKGEKMGIPQTRHRVFFVATRLDFDLDKINMTFDYEPITYGKIKEGKGRPINKNTQAYNYVSKYATEKDLRLCDIFERLKQKPRCFGLKIAWDCNVLQTITAALDYIRGEELTTISLDDIIHAQTFPEDYNFLEKNWQNVSYFCGMSVPPIMMKRVVTRLIESGLFDYKLKENR